jgi:hypothetical protein
MMFVFIGLLLVLSLKSSASWKISPSSIKKTATAALLAGSFMISAAPVPVQALSDPDAIARFGKAADSLLDLDSNWDKVVLGEGDNIRRVLGTVFSPPTCTSPLCSFSTFVTSFIKGSH